MSLRPHGDGELRGEWMNEWIIHKLPTVVCGLVAACCLCACLGTVGDTDMPTGLQKSATGTV